MCCGSDRIRIPAKEGARVYVPFICRSYTCSNPVRLLFARLIFLALTAIDMDTIQFYHGPPKDISPLGPKSSLLFRRMAMHLRHSCRTMSETCFWRDTARSELWTCRPQIRITFLLDSENHLSRSEMLRPGRMVNIKHLRM